MTRPQDDSPDPQALLRKAEALLRQSGGLHDANSGGTVIVPRDVHAETLAARYACYALADQIHAYLAGAR